jgi:ComF family protein
VFDATLALFLAARCAACDRVLEYPLGGPVCDDCWRAVPLISPPRCVRCGDPLASADAVRATCVRCRRLPRAVDRGIAAGLYEGSLRAIVQAFKYERRRSLADGLARLMRQQGASLLEGADFLIAVPLHPLRRLTRGFNQADDLARRLELPVVKALRRVRRTSAQAALPAARRHRNVRGVFELSRGYELVVRDRIVVLVDDVSTTGATVEACARVLKGAGVREVRVLTAARVVTVRPGRSRLALTSDPDAHREPPNRTVLPV